MGAKIRRLENNLMTLGTGVIAFGAWQLAKTMLSVFLFEREVLGVIETTDRTQFIITLWTYVILDFLSRCFIGFSARSESRGKRKLPVYLVLTALLITITVLGIVAETIVGFSAPDQHAGFITTVIIDLTSLVFLAELFGSSVMLRRLRKKPPVTEGGAA